MNILEGITRAYGKLHNYEGIPYWVLTPLRKFLRFCADFILPWYLLKTRKKCQVGKDDIIVSLTSFPGRIQHVWKSVECLKRQTVRPRLIVLWLSKDQFPNSEDIPSILEECVDDLFEIRMVDGDIRSHKKYYYAFQEFPDFKVITCDDDVYYHPDTIKNLVATSKLYPNCIIANTTRRLSYDKNGNILPYLQWKEEFVSFSTFNNVQIGIGGVLYPPHCLHSLVLRRDLFMKLTPMADDLWLNLMARLNKTPVVQTGENILFLDIHNDGASLSSINNGMENMNDKQICKIREWLIREGVDDVYNFHYKVK